MTDGVVERIVETVLPTRHGTFRLVGYRGADGTEHVALTRGVADGAPPQEPPLVRVHSECLTGDALGSRRCDCGEQLDAALARVAEAGLGVVVYVRGHEGRGIGLIEKLRAYALQDTGVDTVDANLALGHPADLRRYDQAASILRDLGLHRIRLMSSNPAKEDALTALGIEVVDRTGMFVGYHPENQAYLRTKRARMNHDAPASEVPADVAPRYAELMAADAWVVAQSAQSMDGLVATASGDGIALSGPEDHRHLHTLRALCDAVVVGAQTVVADNPRLTVRLVPGASPVRVVVDPRGRTPASARVFTDGRPTLWLVGPGVAPRPGVDTVVLDEAGFEPAAIVELLAAQGLGRVLVEGGGRTVSRFLRAGAVDRLFVTVVPRFLGEGVAGVRVPGVATVKDAARLHTRSFVLDDATCTEFVLRPQL